MKRTLLGIWEEDAVSPIDGATQPVIVFQKDAGTDTAEAVRTAETLTRSNFSEAESGAWH